MKGYAKIKENNPFFQRSKSKKQNPFLDQHLDVNSSNLDTQKSQENDQKPNIFAEDLFQAKTSDDHGHDHDDDHEDSKSKVSGNVLRRNLTVSGSKMGSGYQKNGKSSKLERQSSTRVIQEVVKRAFSMRRCSSVNNSSSSNSDRYCRIYDQPKNVEDSDYVYHDDNHGDYGFEKMKKNKDDYDYDYSNNSSSNNSGKKHVGCKVVKACKRLFSR